MNIEQVIARFERQGATRGKTASPGSSYYERACNLDFQICTCSGNDPERTFSDYIAKTEQAAYLYVGVDPVQHVISCGPKGYHDANATRPCI